MKHIKELKLNESSDPDFDRLARQIPSNLKAIVKEIRKPDFDVEKVLDNIFNKYTVEQLDRINLEFFGTQQIINENKK